MGAAMEKVLNPQNCVQLALRSKELLPPAIKNKKDIHRALFPAINSRALPVFPGFTYAYFEIVLQKISA